MAAESEFEPFAGDVHMLMDSGQASFEMAAVSEFEPHACTTLGEGGRGKREIPSFKFLSCCNSRAGLLGEAGRGGRKGTPPFLNFCHATIPGRSRATRDMSTSWLRVTFWPRVLRDGCGERV